MYREVLFRSDASMFLGAWYTQAADEGCPVRNAQPVVQTQDSSWRPRKYTIKKTLLVAATTPFVLRLETHWVRLAGGDFHSICPGLKA